MTKFNNIVFFFIVASFLFSCREDKGNESMPLNKIKGSYEPQLNYLNEALEDDPDDDELLYKRAKVFVNLYRNAEALADINAAINVHSNKKEYYLVLAQANFALGNYFETIKACEKAESMGLEDPDLIALQAAVYWETGDTTRSTLYLNRITQVAPFHSGVNLLKAKQAAAHRDTVTAVSFLLTSIRNDRTNTEAYRDLIRIYLNRGKDDSAMYYVIQAKEINPHHPDFYYTEGRIFAKRDMKQSAIISYKYCLKEDTAYAPAVYQLGYLYYREGNPIEAFKYLKRYTALNNENKEVYRSLIAILTEQNKEEATIPYYERLIQLDSLDMGLKYKLQKLYNEYAISRPVETTPVTTTPVTTTTTTPVVRTDTTRKVVRRDTTVRKAPAPVMPDTAKHN